MEVRGGRARVHLLIYGVYNLAFFLLLWGVVLLIAAVTNYCRFDDLKTTPMYVSHGHKSRLAHLVSLGFIRLKLMSTAWVYIGEALGKSPLPSSCCHNLVPCCCKTELPISLLIVLRAVLAPKGSLLSFTWAPVSQIHQIHLILQISDFPFCSISCLYLEKVFCF